MGFETALEWLLMPIDSNRAHSVDWFVSWHARLMVIAWAVFIPVGILIARYMKILPKQKWPEELDNRTWWYAHLGLQWFAATLTVLALGLIIYKVSHISILENTHHALGWLTITLMVVQVLAGMFRGSKGGPTYPAPDGSWRGDHYDMTIRRKIFEYMHKTLGYFALVTSILTIIFGLWLANGPIWMWIMLALWWASLCIIAIWLQSKKKAIDTYQAIWGPDPDLPGNKIQPIGLGITRPNFNKNRDC